MIHNPFLPQSIFKYLGQQQTARPQIYIFRSKKEEESIKPKHTFDEKNEWQRAADLCQLVGFNQIC